MIGCYENYNVTLFKFDTFIGLQKSIHFNLFGIYEYLFILFVK